MKQITYRKKWGTLHFWTTKYVALIYKESTQPKRKWIDNEPLECYYVVENSDATMRIVGELNKSPVESFNHLGESRTSSL